MSAAVNKPTNTKVKESDVNKKLQFYGIYSAFANGKVPSNKQIDKAMNSALASRPLAKPSNRLSAEGKLLVADLRDVIEKAKVLLLTKNEGNVLQDFIYQCTQVSVEDASTPNAPVDKETAKQHGNEALEGLKTLGTLLLSNGQFRKLLNDSLILFRDMGGDAAQKIAAQVNPDEEALKQIDRPAEDNTWHEVPSAGELKDKLKTTVDKVVPIKKDDAKDAAADAQNAAQSGSTATDGAATGANAAASSLDNKMSEQDKENAKKNANEARDKASAKAKEAREKTKNYLSEKMPEERRDQAIWRLKKMVVEIQGHPDYQRAIDTLLRLAETYKAHGENVKDQSKDAVKGAHTDTGLERAEANLKLLVERFANGTSTDDLWDSINQLYKDADADPELKTWFKDLDTYFRKCLKEQGYVMLDEATTEWNKLYDHGDFLLRHRYRNHTDRIVDEVKFLADEFEKDPLNKAFGDSMDKLFKDLGQDVNGKPVFKKHLVKDLSEVIMPAFFENVRYIPIPRIEFSDPMADAIIENLVIEGDNLAPNVFEFGSDNWFRWGRANNKSKNKNKVMLAVSGIQMDLRDVSYYINKKQGFPKIQDKGVMDIFLGGTGFSFKAALETADDSDKNHFFKVNTVDVDVKHMNIKLKQSKHKLLFNIVRPLLLRVMRPILKAVLSAQIRKQINELDAYLHEIYLDAKKLEEEAKRDPENASNIFNYYFQAFQRKMTEKKEKAEAVESRVKQSEVNVAFTQHDSIFKNITLPGGISSKATEYKELAGKGDKWETSVFTIGSAPETSLLPKAPEVSRKPHTATPSVLKDKSEVAAQKSNGSAAPNTMGTTLGSSNPVVSGSA